MNYKSIFRSRAMRFRILKLLSFVPDSIMLRLQYRIKLGFWPNFKHPKRFTEKLQLYKMYYRNPEMARCVDKYEVRGYLEERGFGHLLNKLYGVYNRAEEIDFSTLPEKFVIKTTDGSGGNNILICRNKSQLDIKSAVTEINSWLDVKSVNAGREWAYTGIKKSRIIVEEFLENETNPETGPEDYKFFCFNGEPKFIYLVHNRKKGEKAHLGIYDMAFIKQPIYRCDEHRSEQVKSVPKNYDLMINIARKLSSGFPHIRVDLYNIDGDIRFGELTFYDGSGYFSYDPDSFDFDVGEWFTEY